MVGSDVLTITSIDIPDVIQNGGAVPATISSSFSVGNEHMKCKMSCEFNEEKTRLACIGKGFCLEEKE